MNQNEKTREMLNGIFVFPNTWEELNPEEARERRKIVFLTEAGKCGVYYSKVEAKDLNNAEEQKVRLLGKKVGFSSNANIYGFIEELENVGNARIVGGGEND